MLATRYECEWERVKVLPVSLPLESLLSVPCDDARERIVAGRNAAAAAN